MKELILFILCFLMVFIVYQIFIVGKVKRKNSKKMPVEVRYLVGKYKLDLKKVDMKKLFLCISIVSSLDISILVSIAFIFENFYFQILSIIILLVPIILISYHIVGVYYTRKGEIKDE